MQEKGIKRDEPTKHTPLLCVSDSTFNVGNGETVEESPNFPAQPNFSDPQANSFHLCSPQLGQCQTLLLLPSNSVLVWKHAAPN